MAPGEIIVGAGPARPNGVSEVNGIFGNVFFRMDCRVLGEYRRRGMTGEQARPYGGKDSLLRLFL